MTLRTRSETITFGRPFALAGLDGVQPVADVLHRCAQLIRAGQPIGTHDVCGRRGKVDVSGEDTGLAA